MLRIAEPVDLGQLLAWQRGLAERPAGWFLSFDDGYRELHDVAAPILLRKGIPATFFFCSSFIDNRQAFFEDIIGLISEKLSRCTPAARAEVDGILSKRGSSLSQLLRARIPQADLISAVTQVLEIDVGAWLGHERPYVTTSQVKSLLNQGFTVGAHSVDHSLFEQIHSEQRHAQLETGIAEIALRFDLDYKVFAFPYGEFGLTREFLESIEQEGLPTCVSALAESRWTNWSPGSFNGCLPRVIRVHLSRI